VRRPRPPERVTSFPGNWSPSVWKPCDFWHGCIAAIWRTSAKTYGQSAGEGFGTDPEPRRPRMPRIGKPNDFAALRDMHGFREPRN
jgi:hypothetical protein